MHKIIEKTEGFVRQILGNESTGHDWHHIDRVRKNALLIQKNEGKGDVFVIEMASLLHDIPDEKLNETEKAGWEKLITYINTLGLNKEVVRHILDCIDTVSYKGGMGVEPISIEAKIVQDADRLDALGAIGVARTFAFGGKKGQPLYDPELSIRDKMTIEEYRSGKSSSVHHFYEKLFKLKDLMNTDSAKQLAKKRHEFMETFIEQFYNEWNGQA